MRRGTNRGDSGAAAVEFALVVPVLLVLVFGIMNFGFIFTAQISMNAAARDAARAAVVEGTGGALTCGEIANRARNSVTVLGAPSSSVGVTVSGYSGSTMCSLAPGAVTATPSGAAGSGGKPCTGSAALNTSAVTVRLSHDFRALVPIVPPQQLTLASTTKFRCEYI